MENKYVNGKIYKIVDNTNGNIYIGSTIQKLNERLRKHKWDYKKYLEGNSHFVSSFEIFKNNDYKIELLEDYPCNSKKNLETKEREFIENNICVNKIIPTRTKKEWNKENKEKIKKYTKVYYEKYYEENKEKMKNQTKKHYEENKEKIKNQTKKYREENKEKIKEYNRQKITCECGAVISIDNLARHKKSLKHIKFTECVIIDTPCS